MVRADALRLLSALSDGSLAGVEPTIDEEGRVEYTEAQHYLEFHGASPRETLDSLAGVGLLEKEYTSKTYVCPSCRTGGLQFITACPYCESTHTDRPAFFEHDSCGYVGPSTEFEENDLSDEHRCPNCDARFDSSELTIERKHRCQECEERFDTPAHRLWCRDCLHLCPPEEAIENTLYDYRLSDDGERWCSSQIDARDLLADEFESRGFEVEVDITVRDGEKAYPVHLRAQDALLDQQLVADVHSGVDAGDVRYIDLVAQRLEARPLVLSVDDDPSTELLRTATEQGVTILRLERDDSITRPSAVEVETESGSNLVKRVTSAFDLSSWKRTS
ncbi:TackOD1 domain-containing metal-binding protein [Halalkalicoccus ordinarius]|uniref:TackOD1 domain-containing metal-binding protein n=1 Tax=Halalkalicoccus ordinarius TaxID=3116651 RepID=UPI00300F6437